MFNFQRANAFRVMIERLPNFTFTTQQVSIPGINMNPAILPTPFTKVKRPGDEIAFEQIQVTFPLLEDFSNYLEIYRWMTGLGFPQNRKQFEKIITEDEVSRMDILVLDSEDNIQMEFIFHDAFPISLSALQMDTSVMSMEPIQVTASFEYTYFTINNLDIDNVRS
jgi:hypothetical protein